jgi:hypothetical protein
MYEKLSETRKKKRRRRKKKRENKADNVNIIYACVLYI